MTKEAVFITTRTFTHGQEVAANSTEQSPSLKANGHSACQEIRHMESGGSLWCA